MRSNVFFAATLGSVLVAGCAGAKVDVGRQEIIGGDPVGGEELPAVGGILTNAGSICTGTLISPTAVLTAAHCVDTDLIKQALQQAGKTPPDEIVFQFSFARDLEGAGADELLAVDSVEWNQQFLMDTSGLFDRPGNWHDIAVMHLAEPVTDRPPQKLAPADVVEALETGRDYLVAGYGLTENGNSSTAGALMKGMSGLDEKGDFELIAGVDDPQQACRGDSGGPIFADDGDTYQIGIASRINADLIPPPSSPPPCETGLLYTRVDVYRDWLEAHVSDLPGAGDGGDSKPGDGEGGGDESDTSGGGCSAAPGSSTGALGSLLLLLALLAADRVWRAGRR